MQLVGKFAVVDPGCLEDNKYIAASPTRHLLCEGPWRVGDALGDTDGFVEDIEGMLGNVDSDAAKC